MTSMSKTPQTLLASSIELRNILIIIFKIFEIIMGSLLMIHTVFIFYFSGRYECVFIVIMIWHYQCLVIEWVSRLYNRRLVMTLVITISFRLIHTALMTSISGRFKCVFKVILIWHYQRLVTERVLGVYSKRLVITCKKHTSRL